MSGQAARSRVFGPQGAAAGEHVLHGAFARALVVDDDEQVRDLLCRFLRRWGTIAVSASDLAEARSRLDSLPDLVLVDLHLPDGSGVALAREASALRPTPLVIGISGKASPKQTFALARAGVCAFLVKPFTEAQLRTAVRNALVEHETEELRAGRHRPLSDITRGVLEGALEAFNAHHGLTPRQQKVVAEIARGTPRSALARALEISENTCKTDIRRLLAHCGLERTTDIPAAVFRHAQSAPRRRRTSK